MKAGLLKRTEWIIQRCLPSPLLQQMFSSAVGSHQARVVFVSVRAEQKKSEASPVCIETFWLSCAIQSGAGAQDHTSQLDGCNEELLGQNRH